LNATTYLGWTGKTVDRIEDRGECPIAFWPANLTKKESYERLPGHGSNTSLFQSVQFVTSENVKDPAKDQADERHSKALDPGFRELKKSRRYKAGDKGSDAQVAEERCSELQPLIVD
jgi:hypothetical protein